ncbi:hypothetical protein ILYODFUR_000228 [Ilyodon furcidens]|uniref:Secreted protein n=1 Tax=Ilyodon furcidens TaxID=33524 RepID=A0ABV0T5E2_9TELE
MQTFEMLNTLAYCLRFRSALLVNYTAVCIICIMTGCTVLNGCTTIHLFSAAEDCHSCKCTPLPTQPQSLLLYVGKGSPSPQRCMEKLIHRFTEAICIILDSSEERSLFFFPPRIVHRSHTVYLHPSFVTPWVCVSTCVCVCVCV